MSKITKYINRIDYFPRFTLKTGKFVFCGDGQGDFEDTGYDATVDVVKGYIDTCIDQIEIAKEWLKEKEEYDKE